MKKILASIIVCSFASVASAESLSIVQSASNENLYSVFINTGDVGATVNAIDFNITPDGAESFQAFDQFGFDGATPRGDDSEATFVNALLTLAATPPFFGEGFSNPRGTTGDENGLTFAGGPIGAAIQPGDLFIANVLLAPGTSATASFDFVGGGSVVGQATQTFGGAAVIPEPTSVALIGLGIAGVVARRRRG